MFSQAIAVANEWHGGQRYGDKPYIVHPIEVGTWLYWRTGDEEIATIGVLHDILEDTSYTRDALADHFGEEIAIEVEKLTRPADQTYRGYVASLTGKARVVKFADSFCNYSHLSLGDSRRARYAGNLQLLYPSVKDEVNLTLSEISLLSIQGVAWITS